MEPSEHQAGHWEPSTAVPGELFICIGQEMVEAWPALQGGRQIHQEFFREGKVVLLQCQPLERKPGSGAKEEATWPRLWSTHELDGQHLAEPLLDWALLCVFHEVSASNRHSGAGSITTTISTLHWTHSWLKSMCSESVGKTTGHQPGVFI